MSNISDLDNILHNSYFKILSLLNTATDHGLLSPAEEARQSLESLLMRRT